MKPSRIITLTTDFGLDDFFVAAMKGVILSINRQATMIDITHTISAHDVRGAALTLADCYSTFPRGTIHVVVVDPGVGSERRPILIESERYFFLGPDNGVFSFIYESEKIKRVIHLTRERFFHRPVSRTFHGRDVFAPCAAWLSKGTKPSRFGRSISDPVKLVIPQVEIIGEKRIRGEVIHVDRFGNLVTNLTERHVPDTLIQSGGKLTVGGHEVVSNKTHYREGKEGEVFAVIGSTGRVEISISQGSAAKTLGVDRGAVVEVVVP